MIQTTGLTGYGSALELGSKFIESENVALMNSDDYVHPERFKLQLEALKDSDVSIAQMQAVNDRGKNRRSMLLNYEASSYCSAFLLLGSFGANATWTMRSEWWAQNAFFDTDAALDWRIALSSFKDSRVSYVPRKMYFYRKHSLQKTQEPIAKESLGGVFNLWNEYLQNSGFPQSSFAIFRNAACPWLISEDWDLSEFLSWAESISPAFDVSHEIHELYWKMIYRRCLLNYRDNYSGFIRDIGLSKSILPYIPSLVRDYLGN